MKKLSLLFLIVLAITLQFCKSSKKAAGSTAKLTYSANIQSVVTDNCAPCHFPPKGNKEPFDTYEGVKNHIDEILVRIQKNPDEKGFMPMKHPKLADSTINLFAQWKKDGLEQ